MKYNLIVYILKYHNNMCKVINPVIMREKKIE